MGPSSSNLGDHQIAGRSPWERQAFTNPLGPAGNLASRLCAEAAHGEILVDARSIELLSEEAKRHHRLLPGEPLQLKGFQQPVQNYTLAPA